MSQPLWDADYIGPEGCDMKVFNGPGFYAFLNTKSRFEDPGRVDS
jgi:hypothetical protein